MMQKQITGFNNGEFTDVSNITIPVDNICVNRGYGVFDFFGIINNKPFYPERHLDRFFNSINMLRLTIKYTPEEVSSLISETIRRNNLTDYYIKLFAIPLNPEVAQNLDCGFFIIPLLVEIFGKEVYETGISIITKEYLRFLPEAKSTNYFPLVFWTHEIKANNAVDVLYYHNNIITETSRGNIFIVKNGYVTTPSKNILKGITRSVVIDIFKQKQVSFTENQITLDELYNADEVFLTSTTKKILPIVKIDDKVIGDGKVGKTTNRLITDFKQLQENWGIITV